MKTFHEITNYTCNANPRQERALTRPPVLWEPSTRPTRHRGAGSGAPLLESPPPCARPVLSNLSNLMTSVMGELLSPCPNPVTAPLLPLFFFFFKKIRAQRGVGHCTARKPGLGFEAGQSGSGTGISNHRLPKSGSNPKIHVWELARKPSSAQVHEDGLFVIRKGEHSLTPVTVSSRERLRRGHYQGPPTSPVERYSRES